MKLDDVRTCLGGFPLKTGIGPRKGEILYDFVLKNKPLECLELGFAHGSSSCYTAAALDELGEGHLTSVDLLKAGEWQDPRIEELLSATGLEQRVTVAREHTSYTWFLKKKIEERTSSNQCQPLYDFCFIDGAKHWTIDGFAFFLVDKLLKPGGWILFDDYGYTFEMMQKRGLDTVDFISSLEMGEDEVTTPHIKSIFDLLVMQHPAYSDFRIQDDWWVWARKAEAPGPKTLVVDRTYTFKSLLWRVLRKLKLV